MWDDWIVRQVACSLDGRTDGWPEKCSMHEHFDTWKDE